MSVMWPIGGYTPSLITFPLNIVWLHFSSRHCSVFTVIQFIHTYYTAWCREVTKDNSTPEHESISSPCIIWMKRFKSMQISSRKSVSPWYVLHLMASCASCLELTSSFVFHSPNKFLRRSLMLYRTRHPQRHWCVFPIVNPGCAQIEVSSLWVFNNCSIYEQLVFWVFSVIPNALLNCAHGVAHMVL